jgi:hypothetical protein
MKQFSLLAVGSTLLTGWLESGFLEWVKPTGDRGATEYPEVIVAEVDLVKNNWEELLQKMFPPVVVVVHPEGRSPCCQLPPEYTTYWWPKGNMAFLIGSRLEDLLIQPDWQSYEKAGHLDNCQCHKAVSDVIYRHLLQEVFRETREWCGHTFSVLGHL